jgi:hypothetical protein
MNQGFVVKERYKLVFKFAAKFGLNKLIVDVITFYGFYPMISVDATPRQDHVNMRVELFLLSCGV